MTLTLDEAKQNLAGAVRQALQGEAVLITVGADTLCLFRESPLRPPGYFAQCYLDPHDAAFEERLCKDSAIVVEP